MRPLCGFVLCLEDRTEQKKKNGPTNRWGRPIFNKTEIQTKPKPKTCVCGARVPPHTDRHSTSTRTQIGSHSPPLPPPTQAYTHVASTLLTPGSHSSPNFPSRTRIITPSVILPASAHTTHSPNPPHPHPQQTTHHPKQQPTPTHPIQGKKV